MKSLVDLLAVLLQDCGRMSGAPVERDILTLRSRVEHEGVSFITITLPNFCRDFERCLDEGRVSPGMFQSFRKEHSGIPSFLKGLLSHVFDKNLCLLSKPSIDCIRAVRQICLFGKKVRLTCSPERVEAAVERYAQCDADIVSPESEMYRYYKGVATVLWCALLENQDFRTALVPRHGPGATRERISGNQKWLFVRWHRRLSSVGFTYAKFGRASVTGLLPCPTHRLDLTEVWPNVIEPEDEEPVRVVLVPKTLKTPRVIAVEPVCMQYAQQALSRWLVERLESCSLTSGHVNFRDQAVNQAKALSSSADGHLATVDMAEASDRVSLTHVTDMLNSVPVFRDWVIACRSTRSQIPSGEVITLKKFASMGSALCFPMEAMVFYTSIIASRLSRAGEGPTLASVREYARDVYVFGDDLIVPADEAPAICEDLESIGLKVNRHKSFWTGKFRESCGADCYDGNRVTPVYLRSMPPADREDASGILSCAATANQLNSAGYVGASMALRKAVERVLGPLPRVPHHMVDEMAAIAKSPSDVVLESPAIGWVSDSDVQPPTRFNKDLQRIEYRCWTPVTTRREDHLEGFPALAKCFRLIGSELPIDPEHLERSSRPYGLALKRRWVPNLI